MIAVKLHKKRKPWLGRGSYLIPIFNWTYGKTYIRNWLRTLEESKGRRKEYKYITLVKIPDKTFLYIHDDWCSYLKYLWELYKYGSLPAVQISGGSDMKVDIVNREFDLNEFWKVNKEAWKPLKEHQKKYKDWFSGISGGTWEITHPEIILGENLPDSCIKWTKDLRLLYKKEKRGYNK